MRDGPACILRWSDVPPSGHCFFAQAAASTPTFAHGATEAAGA
jgi:hypothetical protein